jgi:hypothetical protein
MFDVVLRNHSSVPAFEIVIIETVTIFTGQIANICYVKFYIGCKSTRIRGILVGYVRHDPYLPAPEYD